MVDALEIFHYWKDFPPVHLVVGAFFGLGKGRAMTSEPTDEEVVAIKTLPVRSYDNLPPDIQQWLTELKQEKINHA